MNAWSNVAVNPSPFSPLATVGLTVLPSMANAGSPASARPFMVSLTTVWVAACMFGRVNTYLKSTVSPTVNEAESSVSPAFESMNEPLFRRSRDTFLSIVVVLDLTVRVPRVTPFRVLVPWTGVPTIMGTPSESTIRYRPFGRSDTVMVVPVPATDFTAWILLADAEAASCLAASRSWPCTVPAGSPSLPTWARSPAASKPCRSVMPALVLAAVIHLSDASSILFTVRDFTSVSPFAVMSP